MPVFYFELSRLLVRKFVSDRWPVYHADVLTKFPNDDKVGQIYVRWDSGPYKWKKSPYGSKQSPLLCYKKEKNMPEGFGCRQYASRKCVFNVNPKRFQVAVSVYVD